MKSSVLSVGEKQGRKRHSSETSRHRRSKSLLNEANAHLCLLDCEVDSISVVLVMVPSVDVSRVPR